MNQKKLKKEVGSAGCRIYTGSIDCLVQVCTFVSFTWALMKLIIKQVKSQVAFLLIWYYGIVELNICVLVRCSSSSVHQCTFCHP
jgi:hypothetical protein